MIEYGGGPLLAGDCNRCGACCVVEQDGVPYTCTKLDRLVGRSIGDPYVTRCSVYFARTHWMPITMVAPDGRRINAHCAANGTEQETLAIIRNGIGKGCSMEVVT